MHSCKLWSQKCALLSGEFVSQIENWAGPLELDGCRVVSYKSLGASLV